MEFEMSFLYVPLNGDKKIEFHNMGELNDFFTVERERWRPVFADAISQVSGGLRNCSQDALNAIDRLGGAISNLQTTINNIVASGRRPSESMAPFSQARQEVQNHLNALSSGTPFPPAESEVGAKVLQIAKESPKEAVAYLALVWNAFARLGVIGNGIELREIIQAIKYLPRGDDSDVGPDVFAGIANLRADYQEGLNRLNEMERSFGEWVVEAKGSEEKRVDVSSKEFEGFVSGKEKGFSEFLSDCRSVWDQLQQTYNTQLALRAPTTYWNNQAGSNRTKYLVSTGLFVAFSAISLGLFCLYGIPYLASYRSDQGGSAIIHVIPVLVPAFVGIWVLKIVSRLMSGFLQRYEDAAERKVMVMTFLALMNDEQNGGTVITEQDRILILHALFRPTTVAPTDDAPPVHWFDLLLNRGKA